MSPSGFGGSFAEANRRARPVGSRCPGSDPGEEVGNQILDGWSTGDHEWCGKYEIRTSDEGVSLELWMPFRQTCDEESGDADFDSFKTTPWDAGGPQSDKLHELMCRAMVHNVDRSTTRNTERELATKMLMDTNCPRLKMTSGKGYPGYRGTQIRGELHDALAISDGHKGRKDDDILRRSAVCVEIDFPADMNCTAVELNDVTILRRRLPQRQDSAEHDECYISVSWKCSVRLPVVMLLIIGLCHAQ